MGLLVWILVIVGLAFVGAALWGAYTLLRIQTLEAAQQLDPAHQRQQKEFDPTGDLIKILPDLIKAVLSGPIWFIMFFCGVVLIAGGVWLYHLVQTGVFKG
ncbi:MAG: hypothetical protein IVW51_09245 [Thermaceae bacterium]|nr:hypothetical protein [Thermaceae bacterium]